MINLFYCAMDRDKRVAIYPGSFDPITNGHLDIISRASNLFDVLIVAVAYNPRKKYLFSEDERISLIKKVIEEEGFRNVKVESFAGLLVSYAKQKGAIAIIRGLRALSDFEYELSLSLMNRNLCGEIETVFLMTNEINSFISSSLVKEVANLGGDISKYVPRVVLEALQKKFQKIIGMEG